MIEGTEKPKIPSKFANTNTTNFAVNRNDKRFFLPCEKNAVDNLFVKDISFVVSTNLRLKSFQLIPISVRLPWFQCTMSKEYESRAR